MRQLILLFIIILTYPVAAQERVASSAIYKDKDGLFFYDGYAFTGIAEYRNRKNHLEYEWSYENGYRTKFTFYYNIEAAPPYEETYYYEKSKEKKQRIRRSSDNSRAWIVNYDTNGKKTLEEEYLNDMLVYRCEYKAGKKHGAEFCTSGDCGETTTYYENGKRIK